MACELVALTTAGECTESDGGIKESYIANRDDITDITFDVGGNGIVENFTMGAVGKWFKYEFDDDDSAFYNQNGERTNRKHTVNQQAFFKFAGISQTKVDFANKIKACCGLVAVHYLNSGAALVQGIEHDLDTDTWQYTKQLAKATVNILTDTGDNEDRIEVNLNSQARAFSPTTTLTGAALEAL